MNRNGNLFINAIQNENSFTELFTNIMIFDDVRIVFCEMFLEKYVETVKYSDFSTQYRIKEVGQPDIRIQNENIDVILEVKISENRNTTEKQDNDYANHLKGDEKVKKVIFIIPQNYPHHLPEGVGIVIIHWETIIDKLKQLPNKSVENPINEFIINEYIDFLEDWFGITKFNNAMITTIEHMEIPLVLGQLHELIDKVKKKINVGIKTNSTNKVEDYGFDFKVGNTTVYLGLWFYYWKTKGFPLSLSIHTHNFKRIGNAVCEYYKTCGLSEPEHVKNKNYKSWHSTHIPKEILVANNNADKLYEILTGLNNVIKANQ